MIAKLSIACLSNATSMILSKGLGLKKTEPRYYVLLDCISFVKTIGNLLAF